MSGGTTRASAVVLAGGRASRFGGPKLGALVNGVPLLHHAVLAVAQVAAEVVVVTQPGEMPDLPLSPVPTRLVHDPEPDAGPLVALAAGLRAASFPASLVVGGDMPRLRPAVLAAMLERLEPDHGSAVLLEPPDAAAPRQPLPMAVETAAALRAASGALARSRRSLQALLDELSVTVLPASEWLRLDPEAGTLDDVDQPADLERLAPGTRGERGGGGRE